MADVGGKPETEREAVASGAVRLATEAIRAARDGTGPKGDVVAAARLAGIQAAKRAWEAIPLCHPVPIDAVEVDLEFGHDVARVTARVRSVARTGVEMEALSAVAAAALTVYDMTKGIDRGAVIESIRLESKSGGKSGDYRRGPDA